MADDACRHPQRCEVPHRPPLIRRLRLLPQNCRMFQETIPDRPVAAGIGWWEGAGLFLIGTVFDLLGDWRGIPHVVAGSLFDPDSYMRLVRIEAGLRAGHIGSLVPRDG